MGSPREVVTELRRKYLEILRLRLAEVAERARTDGLAEQHPRAALASLATSFPGALRELDGLPLAELEARLAELDAAAKDPERAPAPWMLAQFEYHSLARGVLAAKRFLAGRRSVDDQLVARFEEFAAASAQPQELREWSSDLARVAQPPSGRLSSLVFEKLGERLAIGAERARALVFGPIDPNRPIE